MIETEIIVERKPKLRKPVLIEGLPGLGLVGKLAVDHMIKELGAKPFAYLYSPHFPPQVNMLGDGTVEMPHDTFYYWKSKKKRIRDIVFVAGDYQANSPFGHYEIAGSILDLAEDMKVNLVYTLGGYGVGYLSKNPKVFGAVTDPRLKKPLEKRGVIFDRKGGIVGAAGLLIGLAMIRDMGGICLMGETHGQIIDARAAKAVLDILIDVLGITLDTSDLEERAKKIEEALEKKEKQVESPEPKEDFNPQYIR